MNEPGRAGFPRLWAPVVPLHPHPSLHLGAWVSSSHTEEEPEVQAGPLQIHTCPYLPPFLLSFRLATGPKKALVQIRLPPGLQRLSGSPSGLQKNVGELGWPGRKGVQGPWQAEADVCAHPQLAQPLGLRKGSPPWPQEGLTQQADGPSRRGVGIQEEKP